MEDNLKEMMGVSSSAGLGVQQNGDPYNAGGDPTNKFGEPPGIPAKRGRFTNILKRNQSLVRLSPNSKKGKPLRNILDPMTPIGRV